MVMFRFDVVKLIMREIRYFKKNYSKSCYLHTLTYRLIIDNMEKILPEKYLNKLNFMLRLK